MKEKTRRKSVTTNDLMVAIIAIDAKVENLDTKLDARTEELKGLIDRRADEFNARCDGLNARCDGLDARCDELMSGLGELMNGLGELHSFTEFSLTKVESRLSAQMLRGFDRMDARLNEFAAQAARG